MWRAISKTVIACAVAVLAVLPVGAYSVGSQGADVLLIQKQLVKRGYKISADGIYGSETSRAVGRFQADKGLDISGNVDAKTYKLLTGKAMPKAEKRRFPAEKTRKKLSLSRITAKARPVRAISSITSSAIKSFRRLISTLAFPMYSAATRRTVLTARVLPSTSSPTAALLCRAWPTSSTVWERPSPSGISFPAIWSFLRPTNRAYRIRGFMSAITSLSVPRRAAVFTWTA